MNIRIHSFVNENSLPYFRYAVENYRQMAEDSANLSFVAYAFSDTTAVTLATDERVDQVVEVYKLAKYFVKQSLRDHIRTALAYAGIYRPMGGSNGHATGLHAALDNTGSPFIDVIADTDTVMLMRGWDRKLAEILETYGILGTSYEPIGGFSSGDGTIQTYKNLPSMTWLALSPKFDFRQLDPKPDKRTNIAIDSQELSDLYNLPTGYELVRDVGWRLPEYLRDHGIPSAVLDHIKPTSPDALAVRSGNDYHEEYQWAGAPFLAHQRGSHQHKFRENPISSDFYDSCESYIENGS